MCSGREKRRQIVDAVRVRRECGRFTVTGRIWMQGSNWFLKESFDRVIPKHLMQEKTKKTALFWSTSEAVGRGTVAHTGERLRRVFPDPACITARTVLLIYVCVPCTRAGFDANRNLIPHFLLISSSSNSQALFVFVFFLPEKGSIPSRPTFCQT